MDRYLPEERSRIMRLVKGKDTGPEIIVRRTLHKLGFRFRLHSAGLPGRPDVVLPRWKVAIFVHGCFWHQHPGCRRAARPKSHARFWNKKLDRNVARDRRNARRLRAAGWRVKTLWECQTANAGSLSRGLERFIREAKPCHRGLDC